MGRRHSGLLRSPARDSRLIRGCRLEDSLEDVTDLHVSTILRMMQVRGACVSHSVSISSPSRTQSAFGSVSVLIVREQIVREQIVCELICARADSERADSERADSARAR